MRPSPVPRPLALAAIALVLAAACTSGSDASPTVEATPTLEASPSATATPPPALTPTSTPAPSPMPTAEPTAEPTPAPVVAVEPDAIAGGASYLWSGFVANPGVPWTSMHVTVGEDPFTDPWSFALGVVPASRFTCFPAAVDAGIALDGCRGDAPAPSFFATADETANELRVSFLEPTAFGPRTVQATLRPVWQRDEPPVSDNVELLWQHHATDIGGSYTDVWSADGVVYAPHFGGTIELLDAASGERIALIAAASSVLDVKVRDGLLYAATTASGLLIYDVSDPAAPTLLGQYAVTVGASVNLFGNAHNIYLDPRRDLVFAINTTHAKTDLRIIDVSEPTAPFEVSRFVIDAATNTLEGAHDVHVTRQAGRTVAFLNTLTEGFHILDVTDPAAIEVLSTTTPDGTFSHSGWVTQVRGRPLYLHGDEGADQRLTLYDVSDLAAPELLADFTVAPGSSVHNIEIDGAIAYVSYYASGLRVYDLSEPESPRQIAHFDTVPPEDERDILQGAWGIHLDDARPTEGSRIVYLSDRESGVYAFRVTLD